MSDAAPARSPRLSPPLPVRVMLAVALLLLLLGTAVTGAVTSGFRETRRHAATLASQGVEAQIERRLTDLAAREAALSEARLLKAAASTRIAAQAWPGLLAAGADPRPVTLAVSRTGALYDPAPTRRSDLWINRNRPIDRDVRRDIEDSRLLDALLPPLLAESPDTAALYFLSRRNVVRYVPPIGLHRLVAASLDFTAQPVFTGAQHPGAAGRTVWSPPYLDDAGHGLLVSASTPVVVQGRFRGIIAADVSLTRLAQALASLKPTPGGFAVLLDRSGRVLAAPDRAWTVLLGQRPPRDPKRQLAVSLLHAPGSALRSLRARLGGRTPGVQPLTARGAAYLLAQAPMPATGWTLLLLAPRDEVTAQYGSVAQAITRDADRTLRWTVALLLGCFLMGLVTAGRLAQTGIIRPVARLTRAARDVAGGRLDVRLPDGARDEFGLLARTFNVMLGSLQAHAHTLKRSEERYELAVRGSNDGLWDWHMDSGEVYYSGRWMGMLGDPAEPRSGTVDTWTDRLHPDDRERILRRLAHLQANRDDLLEFECRLRHQDGQYRWILSRAAVQRNASGRPVRLAGSHTDITDRVEALRVLEDRVAARTRDLEALLSVTRNLTYAEQLKDNLDRLAHSVVSATGASAVTVLLNDATGSTAEGHALSVGAADCPGPRRGPPMPPAPNPLRPRDPPSTLTGGPEVITLPLVYGERHLGLLRASYADPARVDDNERRLLGGLATQAAVVVENARLFAAAQNHAALEERQKLARDLHDSVSQALYGIALGGRTALRHLERAPDQAPDAVRYMLSLAEAGLAEMRALIFELRPESLEQEGLSMALTKLASALHARHALEVSLDVCGEPGVPLDSKVALLRIAQEATHNTVKHARARTVQLTLTCGPDTVVLDIQDDGAGFDVNDTGHGGLGQTSMRERARGIGGTCTVTSEAGRGTRVRVEAPVHCP